MFPEIILSYWNGVMLFWLFQGHNWISSTVLLFWLLQGHNWIKSTVLLFWLFEGHNWLNSTVLLFWLFQGHNWINSTVLLFWLFQGHRWVNSIKLRKCIFCKGNVHHSQKDVIPNFSSCLMSSMKSSFSGASYAYPDVLFQFF